MKQNSREAPPVRLANPTAESFVASLKVVHFFAIFFLWLVTVALVLHIASVVVFQVGVFDMALGLEAEVSPATVSVDGGAATMAASDDANAPAEGAEAEGPPWWTAERSAQVLRYVTQLMRTMRLVGLLTAMLLLVTLFVYLEISLLGRLAGIKYLTMSFFLMLLFVATVYSWEPLLPGSRILGSFYSVDDFLSSYMLTVQRAAAHGPSGQVTHYGRYLAMPVVSLVLLVASWLRFRRGYEESVLLNE